MRLEDLEVWKRVVRLSVSIYKELSDLKDRTFKDQITRSGLSIPSNIAEGFERGFQKQSVAFLGYAKGSCGELRTQVYIGMDIGYIDSEVGARWLSEAIEISSMLGSLMNARRKFIWHHLLPLPFYLSPRQGELHESSISRSESTIHHHQR